MSSHKVSCLVLSYPVLSDPDFETIQRFRKDNDELYYSIVDPHFTLVFPVYDMEEIGFVNEIKQKTKETKRFDFTLRCATISKDAFNDYYHVFLVPDEGFSSIVKLHDELYSGLLFNQLRLDIDFIPHIGIGNSKDKLKCKKLVDEWNSTPFAIHGQVNQLTIVKFTDNKIIDLEEIRLK